MDAYTEVIAKEQANLERLETAAEACRQRIDTLKQLQLSFVESCTEPATKEGKRRSTLRESSDVVPVGRVSRMRGVFEAPSAAPVEGDRLRKNSIAGEVLPFIGAEGKALDEIFDFLHGKGRETTRGTLRTLLMSWRKNRSWIENPHPGFYKLTNRGVRLAKHLEQEA